MAGKVAIIDYGAGNLRSAAKAFEHVVLDQNITIEVIVTSDARDVKNADHIVLPGQGAFGDCMQGLKNLDGMIETLEETVRHKGRPFLGICVGMQLLADKGLEHGSHDGLGWISGSVDTITPEDPSLKIPHMGWNKMHFTDAGLDHPVLKRLENDAYYYFVHSFMFQYGYATDCLGETDYGGPVTAMVGKDSILGIQCHPEKSQEHGLEFIAGFLRWKP